MIPSVKAHMRIHDEFRGNTYSHMYTSVTHLAIRELNLSFVRRQVLQMVQKYIKVLTVYEFQKSCVWFSKTINL